MELVSCSGWPYGQVEVNGANCESFMTSKAGQLDGLLVTLSPRMLTTSNITREMMLMEDPESSIALFSSTPFTLAVM